VVSLMGSGPIAGLLGLAVLLAAVFATVYHADVVAHRTGEPYGTLILTVAITVIEVGLILSILLSGSGSPTLARDTVFAVVMIVLNGLVGACILVGGLRHGEVGFRVPGASSYLLVVTVLATLVLLLPNATRSAPGALYSPFQLAYVGTVTLLLYGGFLYVQTVRHKDYFLSDDGHEDDDEEKPSSRQAWMSLGGLVVSVTAIVLLAKASAGAANQSLAAIGAPPALTGVLVALLVLLPETASAIRAARRNEMQKSLNLALGSVLATIGLTIPAVAAATLILGKPLALGLDSGSTVLLVLTLGVSSLTLGLGRTSVLPGFVHLVLFATYVFLLFAP
jgi:Ca2+:H+ antiporter